MANILRNTATDFSFRAIFSEAWQSVKGAKLAFFTLFIAICLIDAVISLITKQHGLLTTLFTISDARHLQIEKGSQFLVNIINVLFYTGIALIAIKQVRHETINIKTGFAPFKRWLPLCVTALVNIVIVCTIMIGLSKFTAWLAGYLITEPLLTTSSTSQQFAQSSLSQIQLLISHPKQELGKLLIVMLYLATMALSSLYIIFSIFSLPLIVDKGKSIYGAIKTSFSMVKKHWFKLCVLMFGFIPLIFMLLFIPAIIGFSLKQNLTIVFGTIISFVLAIWLIPFMAMLYGVSYRRLS